MKLAVLLVLLCVASASQINSIANTKDFAMGLLTGLHASEKIAHSEPCIQDIQAAAPKMQEAIADIYTL